MMFVSFRTTTHELVWVPYLAISIYLYLRIGPCTCQRVTSRRNRNSSTPSLLIPVRSLLAPLHSVHMSSTRSVLCLGPSWMQVMCPKLDCSRDRRDHWSGRSESYNICGTFLFMFRDTSTTSHSGATNKLPKVQQPHTGQKKNVTPIPKPKIQKKFKVPSKKLASGKASGAIQKNKRASTGGIQNRASATGGAQSRNGPPSAPLTRQKAYIQTERRERGAWKKKAQDEDESVLWVAVPHTSSKKKDEDEDHARQP